MTCRFLDIVRMRRSVRAYRPDPVPRELIERCLEAVRYAPTACNKQAWRFWVTGGETKDRIVAEALGGIVPNRWASTAPVIVAVAMRLDAVTYRAGAFVRKIDYHAVDAGIAGEHFVLQAAECGLGTCWIGWFDKKKVKRILGIPPNWDVPALIALGWPAEEPAGMTRAPVAEISEFRGGDGG